VAPDLLVIGVIVVAIIALVAALGAILANRRRAAVDRPQVVSEWTLHAPDDGDRADPAGRSDPIATTFRQHNESELAWRMRTARAGRPAEPFALRNVVPPDPSSIPLGARALADPRNLLRAGRTPALSDHPPTVVRRTHRRATAFVVAVVAILSATVVIALPTWTGAVLDSRATARPSLPAGGSVAVGSDATATSTTTAASATAGATHGPTAAPEPTGRPTSPPHGPSGGGGGGPNATPGRTPDATPIATRPIPTPADRPTPGPTPGPTPSPTPTPRPTPTPTPIPTPTPRPTPTPTPRPTPTPTPRPTPTPAPTPAPGKTPRVDFSFAITGSSVQFTNRTKFGVTYVWSFGDGKTSTAADPTHTYASPGAYTVTLVATGQGGRTAERSRTITIAG
jgi:hypothetical protein